MELEYWEHKFISVSIIKENFGERKLDENSFGEEILNIYGKDRWEAVDFVLIDRNFAVILMKRRINY